MSGPFDSLTEGERACLRLVHHGLTAKEIGLHRDISHLRVVDILKSARKKFPGMKAYVLARQLVEYEAELSSSKPRELTGARLWDLARHAHFPSDAFVNAPLDTEAMDETVTAGQAQAPFSPTPAFHLSLSLPIGRNGSESNALTIPLTLITIGAGALLLLAAISSGASIYPEMSRLLVGH